MKWLLLAVVTFNASGCATTASWCGHGANAHHCSRRAVLDEPDVHTAYYDGTMQERNLLRAAVYANIDGGGK